VIDQIESYVNDTLGGIDADGEKKQMEVILYDSKSDTTTCSEMAQKLCEEDKVDLIIAIQTPETAIPVASIAERYEVPCIGIQAPVNAVADAAEEYLWTYHAFWTIENVYEQYKALWTQAGFAPGEGHTIGLAFANDADGTAWHQVFAEKIVEDGYNLIDPGQYPSGTTDFTGLVADFKNAKIDILAGTNIPPDFSNLWNQMLQAGISVECVTMGKCCLLLGDVQAIGEDIIEGVMTEVWWTPDHPYASALTGVDCATLGAAYSADNGGRPMPQPAGYAYAAIELAAQVLIDAGTTDKAAVRDALAQTDTTTIVGPIKYDKVRGGLHYGDTVICGGQWQRGDDGALTLVMIDNSLYPEVPITGAYVAGNASNK
jgi:branched-chain amino acid transport system substrate-binding protein